MYVYVVNVWIIIACAEEEGWIIFLLIHLCISNSPILRITKRSVADASDKKERIDQLAHQLTAYTSKSREDADKALTEARASVRARELAVEGKEQQLAFRERSLGEREAQTQARGTGWLLCDHICIV